MSLWNWFTRRRAKKEVSMFETTGKLIGDVLRRREDCEIQGKLNLLTGKPFICHCTESIKP